MHHGTSDAEDGRSHPTFDVATIRQRSIGGTTQRGQSVEGGCPQVPPGFVLVATGTCATAPSFYPSQAFGTRGTTRGTVRMRNTLLISTAELLAGEGLAAGPHKTKGGGRH